LLGLASFSLFGLLDQSLILYLFVFFLIAFFTIGSLMMAVGSAVNDMREAQSLMMPLMLLLMTPWFLWFPISRNPNSTLAVVVSFLPPVNSFGMLLRMSSTSPPPMWQVWLSIGVGIVGVVGAVWFASKVFRIGLLMFGRPPNLATLIRWVRAADPRGHLSQSVRFAAGACGSVDRWSRARRGATSWMYRPSASTMPVVTSTTPMVCSCVGSSWRVGMRSARFGTSAAKRRRVLRPDATARVSNSATMADNTPWKIAWIRISPTARHSVQSASGVARHVHEHRYHGDDHRRVKRLHGPDARADGVCRPKHTG
jgi:hypothetical protein